MILDSLNELIFKPVDTSQIFQNLKLSDEQQKPDKEKGAFECGTMLSSLASSTEVKLEDTPSASDLLLGDRSSDVTSYVSRRETRCVWNFSSFAHLVTNNDDPLDVMAALETGAFKVKPSKSSKKRRRKHKKKMDNRLALISKAVNEEKQRKKDVKKLARRLAKI